MKEAVRFAVAEFMLSAGDSQAHEDTADPSKYHESGVLSGEASCEPSGRRDNGQDARGTLGDKVVCDQ